MDQWGCRVEKYVHLSAREENIKNRINRITRMDVL